MHFLESFIQYSLMVYTELVLKTWYMDFNPEIHSRRPKVVSNSNFFDKYLTFNIHFSIHFLKTVL